MSVATDLTAGETQQVRAVVAAALAIYHRNSPTYVPPRLLAKLDEAIERMRISTTTRLGVLER